MSPAGGCRTGAGGVCPLAAPIAAIEAIGRNAEQPCAKVHALFLPCHGAGVLIGLPFSATSVAAIFTGTVPVLIP